MRRRSAVIVAGAAILAGAVAFSFAGCSAHPTEALSKLAHLDQGTMLAADQEPPLVPGADAELVRSSLRLLTDHDGTQFWVGVTRADDVCFIAESAAGSPGAAGPDAEAATAGTGGSVTGLTAAPGASSGTNADTGSAGGGAAGTGAVTGSATLFAPRSPNISTVVAADGTVTSANCITAEHFGWWGATLHLGTDGARYWLHTEYMTVGPAWTALSANVATIG